MDDALVQGLITGSIAATDTLSPFSLFLQADLVVKAVMLVLVLASVMSWAVIFDKWRRMRRLNRDANRFEELFWSVASLEDLHTEVGHKDRDPMSCVFGEAMLELQGSFGSGTLKDATVREALQARVEEAMAVGDDSDRAVFEAEVREELAQFRPREEVDVYFDAFTAAGDWDGMKFYLERADRA